MSPRSALAAMLVVAAIDSAAARQPRPSWAITGATLIDGTGAQPIPHAIVTGYGDRIECAGTVADCPLPSGATLIDAAGKWVIPGLIDTHVHLDWAEGGGAERVQRIRLAFGITTTREAGTVPTIDEQLARRAAAVSPALPQPRLVVSALVSDAIRQRAGVADLPALVRALAAQGADAIKIKQDFTAAELHDIVSAAHAAGLPVFGHTWGSRGSQLEPALAAGVDGLSHMATFSHYGQRSDAARSAAPDGIEFWLWNKELWNYQDEARLQAARKAIVARQTWIEPMLVAERHFTVPEPLPDEFAYLGPPSSLRGLVRPWIPVGSWGWPAIEDRRRRIGVVFDHMCAFVKGFHADGGMVITGTDEPQPGLPLLDEVRLLTECGLSPLEALQAATQHAATALRQPDIGVVRAGKLADLVIVDGDPLDRPDNLRRVWRVVKGGQIYDPRDLLEPFSAAYRRQARRAWVMRVAVMGAAVGAVAWVLAGSLKRRRREARG